MRASSSRRSVIVPCRTGRHRVRLGRGLRLWRSARCPVCRTAVDPSRRQRAIGWLRTLARPASDAPLDRALWWASVAFMAGVLAAVVALRGMGDVWWPATAFMFGPRWVLALPLAGLLPAAAIRDRALLVPLAIAALVVAGPIVELRTGWRALAMSPDPAVDIRVVTYNVQGGNGLVSTAAGMAREWDADILLFQECGGTLAGEIREIAGTAESQTDGRAGWDADAGRGLCVLSRFPILEIDEMDRTALQAAGGSGQVITYAIDMEGTAILVTNVHLETPRDGFALLRSGQILGSIPVIREKSYLRRIELVQARRWADRNPATPRIVAGDFNTTPESRAYRAAWSDWTNVWSQVGRGYGGTRLNGWIRPRIDHVVIDRNWEAVRAEVGADLGSDHLPVVATVRIRAGRR